MKRFQAFPRREAGVGIVTAIFLLVVLAGLGVAMVGVYTAQQASSNLDLLGARAYQAARAGLEWGIFQVRQATPNCQDRTSFPMPAGTSLTGFTVVVNCSRPINQAGLTRYVITATACNMPNAQGDCPVVNNAESVRRVLEAET
jgi:MSHA biogenesis protein MshP